MMSYVNILSHLHQSVGCIHTACQYMLYLTIAYLASKIDAIRVCLGEQVKPEIQASNKQRFVIAVVLLAKLSGWPHDWGTYSISVVGACIT